jgi:hypothetical protein
MISALVESIVLSVSSADIVVEKFLSTICRLLTSSEIVAINSKNKLTRLPNIRQTVEIVCNFDVESLKENIGRFDS